MSSANPPGARLGRHRTLQGAQQAVAEQGGITLESPCRFERGHGGELGARELLAVLGMKISTVPMRQVGARRVQPGVKRNAYVMSPVEQST